MFGGFNILRLYGYGVLHHGHVFPSQSSHPCSLPSSHRGLQCKSFHPLLLPWLNVSWTLIHAFASSSLFLGFDGDLYIRCSSRMSFIMSCYLSNVLTFSYSYGICFRTFFRPKQYSFVFWCNFYHSFFSYFNFMDTKRCILISITLHRRSSIPASSSYLRSSCNSHITSYTFVQPSSVTILSYTQTSIYKT